MDTNIYMSQLLSTEEKIREIQDVILMQEKALVDAKEVEAQFRSSLHVYVRLLEDCRKDIGELYERMYKDSQKTEKKEEEE